MLNCPIRRKAPHGRDPGAEGDRSSWRDILPVDVRAMKRYQFETGSLMMTKFTVFRSGYTGEDGVEVIIPRGWPAWR